MKLQRVLVGLFVVAVSAAAVPVHASAAPGALDPSFGGQGVVKREFNDSSDGNAILIQPDGKLVVAGTLYPLPTGDAKMLLARFNVDGTPDSTFNGDGASLLGISGENVTGAAAALQPDGKIVVAGSGAGEWAFARFTSLGAPDGTFGSAAGVFTRSVDGSVGGGVRDLAIQANGRIIASGYTVSGDLGSSMLALNGNGSSVADNSWGPNGGNGALKFEVAGGEDDLFVAAEQLPDGAILAVSAGENMPGDFVRVIRVTSAGLWDLFWSPAPVPGGDGFRPNGAALQPDGKLVVVGSRDTGAAAFRINPDGSLDGTFGVGGWVAIPLAGNGYLLNATIQPDGKIVGTGAINSSGDREALVLRLLPSGALDASFGIGGLTRINFGLGDDDATGAVVQGDQRIVATGTALNQGSFSNGDVTLARVFGVEDPVALTPVSKITKPSKRTLKRKRFTKVSGTAGPAGAVARVEVAIRRVDAKALKKNRCVWLRSNKATFKKNKATKKKCTKQVWLKAKGTSKWSFSLKKKKYLPKGSYEIFSRTTLTDGTKQTTFTTKAGNIKKLKLN